MSTNPEHAELAETIERAYAEPGRRTAPDVRDAVERTIALLDAGTIRVATRSDSAATGASNDSSNNSSNNSSNKASNEEGTWTTHAWVKQAVLLYFGLRSMETFEVGPFEYHDKIPLKRDYAAAGVRVVPPGVARYGAHLERGVILMPGYVNIGAYVGSGTMVDTWATVGSCAQIGRDVHLSGGVGIGGVLEPPGATPVIVEDGAFVGSRAIVVEGVRVGAEAVIGANVVLTASTKIIDVTGSTPTETTGVVPPRAVVIPGTRPKRFNAGEFGVPCALIIGRRSESTDRKVSLNAALREHDVAV